MNENKIETLAKVANPTLIDDPELPVEFSNYTQVTMNKNEVVLFFTFQNPLQPENANIFSKIVISTDHARRINEILGTGLATIDKAEAEQAEKIDKERD